MSAVQQSADALARTSPRVATRRGPRRSRLAGNWWRHVVGILAAAFALFPIVYVVSAAFNADQSLGGSSLIPRKVTFENFHRLFTDESTNYLRWFGNSLIVATITAVATVLLGALAAYAFSRFRFRGRRLGLLALLLIQMFPQLLLVVAIYLIVLHTGEVFGFLDLNTLTALIVVYLGGVMVVNVCVLKFFCDLIPVELVESARVHGATHA